MMVRKRYFSFGRKVDAQSKEMRDLEADIRAAEELTLAVSQIDALRHHRIIDIQERA